MMFRLLIKSDLEFDHPAGGCHPATVELESSRKKKKMERCPNPRCVMHFSNSLSGKTRHILEPRPETAFLRPLCPAKTTFLMNYGISKEKSFTMRLRNVEDSDKLRL